MPQFSAPQPDNAYLVDHIRLVRYSFQHHIGQDFPLTNTEMQSDEAIAEAIFKAPFMVVSHNTEADPIFNYANQVALELFEMTWDEFTILPSRKSAEPPNREERSRLLHTVTTQGYIKHYSGIRISKTGRRFRIKDATVWNLISNDGTYRGQAASSSQWNYV
ncbi:MAG: MEKHLA domain-containing protein [Merismopedia sp. SIO2A8]|nr:MEKHLA domain-containing protein [Symploca sp. SIO2B6]NET49273.1 MEKHLA domain-containing protein [Merismopedia sp. SIO2A8]